MVNILEWPSEERPREKLLTKGASSLSNSELLAILFGKGIKGKSAIDLARECLQQHRGLRGLLSANYETFCELSGMGLGKYSLCHAAIELGRRHLEESIQRDSVITQFKDAEKYLIASLRGSQHEIFACLFLDNRHRVIDFEKLFHGSIDITSVHPRELIKRILHHNAAAVILAHNHPSGISKPSEADREVTQQLVKSLQLIDVRLLDHIIIGETTTSFAEMGLL